MVSLEIEALHLLLFSNVSYCPLYPLKILVNYLGWNHFLCDVSICNCPMKSQPDFLKGYATIWSPIIFSTIKSWCIWLICRFFLSSGQVLLFRSQDVIHILQKLWPQGARYGSLKTSWQIEKNKWELNDSGFRKYLSSGSSVTIFSSCFRLLFDILLVIQIVAQHIVSFYLHTIPSEWSLLNARWIISQPYHGENKLYVDEIKMMPALY
jgi:hypothetical protein